VDITGAADHETNAATPRPRLSYVMRVPYAAPAHLDAKTSIAKASR